MAVKRRPSLVTGSNIYSAYLHNDLQNFFGSEYARVRKILVDIIRLSNTKFGTSVGVIRYKDIRYYTSAGGVMHIADELPEALHEDMENYLSQQTKINADVAQIRSVFSAAAVRCTCNQDYRDSFPDVLWANSDNDILKLSRTREAGYSLTNKVLYRQFMSGVDLLNYHQFSKLVM